MQIIDFFVHPKNNSDYQSQEFQDYRKIEQARMVNFARTAINKRGLLKSLDKVFREGKIKE